MEKLTIKQILEYYASGNDGWISPKDFKAIEKDIEQMYREREYD